VSDVEIKLLILYILCAADMPLASAALSDIILSDALINFFEAHLVIAKMLKENLITEEDGLYTPSDTGRQAAAAFAARIPYSAREKIAARVNELKGIDEMSKLVSASYKQDGENFAVSLKMNDKPNSPLIDMRLTVPDKTTANDICKKWKENYSELYNDIIKTLC